jgi:hypothetical protein
LSFHTLETGWILSRSEQICSDLLGICSELLRSGGSRESTA